MKRIRLGMLCLILITLCMMLVSCTSGNKKNQTEATDFNKPLVENPALSRTQTLIVATSNVHNRFNPLFSETKSEKWVSALIFEGLYRIDSSTGELMDNLAELPEISEDQLTYIIQLKENLKFHSGDPVRVEDILFTYNTIKNEFYEGEFSKFADVIETVTVIDEQTIQVKLTDSKHENLGLFTVPILSENYYQFSSWTSFENENKNPMGTGSMKFDQYTENEKISLKTNREYWGNPAKIEGVDIVRLNLAEAQQAFIEGKIDLFELPRQKSIVNEIKKLEYSNIIIENSNINLFIGMDLTNPLFSENYMRKILLYGLNREEFILSEFGGYAEIIHNIATCPEEYEVMEEPLDTYTYSVERAIQVLEDFGWKDTDGNGYREKNGEKLAFVWTVFSDVEWSYNLANFASDYWTAIGVEVTLKFVDYESMMTSFKNGEKLPMWNLAWEMEYGSNPNQLFGRREDEQHANYSGFSNFYADELFEKIDLASSKPERSELYKQWHSIQNSELPYLPIARLKNIWAYNEHIKNLNVNNLSMWPENITFIEIEGLK